MTTDENRYRTMRTAQLKDARHALVLDRKHATDRKAAEFFRLRLEAIDRILEERQAWEAPQAARSE